MQEKLVIVINAEKPATPACALLDSEGKVKQLILQAEPTELPALAAHKFVTVLVPTEDVFIASVTLPKMNRTRLLQAIPYALEEQMIEDVDTLHFAAGEYKPNEPVPVLVTARDKMNEWMTLLQTWHVTADEMIPAVFALPITSSEWKVLVNDTAIVRTGLVSGFASDKENLQAMLAMALEGQALLPQVIQIENLNEDILALSLPVRVEQYQKTAEQYLEMLAQGMAVTAPVDLLQGDYQNKKSHRLPLSNLLKISVYLAVAWLALLFLYPVISFALLDSRANEIDNQIAAIYKRHFPNAANIVLAKERMQQKLTKLTSGVGENRLLMLMVNIGSGLKQASGVQLKRMDFQNNLMTLEITANTSSAFSAFTDALSQQGLRVTQQNANLNGARVSATLQIE